MQSSFSDLECANKKKRTRRDRFLSEIEAVAPWAGLVAELEGCYPKGSGRGRPPIGLERMLRMYVAQRCFGFSDEGTEDALHDSQSSRRFVGIDLARESAPDATTLLEFRRLPEEHQLTRRIFGAVKVHLADKGLLLRDGSIVDATIIAAPASTKNVEKARDAQTHQAKKGEQWHFGMKARIGVGADSGLTDTLVATAANVGHVTQVHALLHGQEQDAFADAGCQGVEKRPENQGKRVVWYVALRPGKRRALPATKLGRFPEQIEHAKASIRAKVEHPFHMVNNLFRHRKARYRGLAKNLAQLSACSHRPIWCWRASDCWASLSQVRPEIPDERGMRQFGAENGLPDPLNAPRSCYIDSAAGRPSRNMITSAFP